MQKYTYSAIVPRQSDKYTVFAFCARASDILSYAQIDRIGRNEDGSLFGFQRPQVAAHIKEIRQYLSNEDAVLPNSVVLAFTSGVSVTNNKGGTAKVKIEYSDNNEKPGFVVDGQQRLTALEGLIDKDFEVFVTGILCENEQELRKQFILINNTKPLPKQLIFELLPTVDGLPQRLSSRSTAASLVERLNYDEASSLHGQIKQHTNPNGVIQDTIMQKIIINSLSDGALRELYQQDNGIDLCFKLISNFFKAVQNTFPDDWLEHKPKTSRLIHGVGMYSMGYVMEYIHATKHAIETIDFEPDLVKLKPVTAWTKGTWTFGEGHQRPWNSLQNISSDYMELSHLLINSLKYKPNNTL